MQSRLRFRCGWRSCLCRSFCGCRLLYVGLLLVPAAHGQTASGAGRFAAAESVLERAIEARAFPGCAFAVGTSDEVLWSGGRGHFVYEDSVAEQIGLAENPVPTARTLYDLASLTKVVGTTSAILVLASQDQLRLEDPVARWLPEFAAGEDRQRREQVTIEHLLVHASGLPSWQPFYREATSYDAVLEQVLRTPLEAAPGTQFRYSDLGFILLGEIAAQAGRGTLAEIEQSRVFGPLAMTQTTRAPDPDQRQSIPPTELDRETQRYVHGVVHDENSRAAGGLTGHAGLFSSAQDLSVFAAEYLQALRGRGQVFRQETARTFTRRRELIEGSSRALGWDTPSGRSSGGSRISPTAFGHTGFTGTSIWIDPQRDLYLILLTNRVHPTRDNQRIARVRRGFADAVFDAMGAGDGTR